jgi:hypothetical protein
VLIKSEGSAIAIEYTYKREKRYFLRHAQAGRWQRDETKKKGGKKNSQSERERRVDENYFIQKKHTRTPLRNTFKTTKGTVKY